MLRVYYLTEMIDDDNDGQYGFRKVAQTIRCIQAVKFRSYIQLIVACHFLSFANMNII